MGQGGEPQIWVLVWWWSAWDSKIHSLHFER